LCFTESHFATNHSHTINNGEDDEMEITGFRRSLPRTALCYLGFVLTLGILRLVMHWWRHWLLLATHTPCPLQGATNILIRENYQGKHIMYYVKKVHTLNAESVREAQLLHEESLRKKKKPGNQTEEVDEIAESLHQPPKEFFSQPFYLPTHLSGGVFKSKSIKKWPMHHIVQ
jgi:P5-type ATPase cation transporter